MGRRRRDRTQAIEEILDAAERLVRSEGPGALKLKRVAAEVGVSHAGVLHHVGSANALLEMVQRRASLQVRLDLLEVLRSNSSDRAEAVDRALEQLSKPENGRLIAWLVASGGEPFPTADERGLEQIAEQLELAGADRQRAVLLATLAMFGESLVGEGVRKRLGMGSSDSDRAEFRRWMLSLLREQVVPDQSGSA